MKRDIVTLALGSCTPRPTRDLDMRGERLPGMDTADQSVLLTNRHHLPLIAQRA